MGMAFPLSAKKVAAATSSCRTARTGRRFAARASSTTPAASGRHTPARPRDIRPRPTVLTERLLFKLARAR